MRRSQRSVIVIAFLAVTTEHFVRFINKGLRLSDAGAEGRLAVLNLACLLGESASPLLLVWHAHSTDGFIKWFHCRSLSG